MITSFSIRQLLLASLGYCCMSTSYSPATKVEIKHTLNLPEGGIAKEGSKVMLGQSSYVNSVSKIIPPGLLDAPYHEIACVFL